MPLSFAAEKSSTGIRKYSTLSLGKPDTSLSLLPATPPPTAPGAPRAGPGRGQEQEQERERERPRRAPGARRGSGGPAAGLSPPVGPGWAGHGDRRDSGSGSAPTGAAAAACYDVSGTAARPAPGALRMRGEGGAEAEAEAGPRFVSGFCLQVPDGNKSRGMSSIPHQPRVLGCRRVLGIDAVWCLSRSLRCSRKTTLLKLIWV